MQIGRKNVSQTGSRLTSVTVHYYNRRGDAKLPRLMTKLPVTLRILLQDWNEARVHTFGHMIAQRRFFCLMDYHDDLTLATDCKLLAELIEPLLIDAITMELRVQMAKKGVTTLPSVPNFESIGAGYVLGGKQRHCRPRPET